MTNFNKLTLFSALLTFNLPTYADITSGLVAHYPFDGNANDESGNGNDGIVRGATLTTNRFGNANSAYKFNGTNNYIVISANDTLNIYPDFSISGWFKQSGYGINNRGTVIDRVWSGSNATSASDALSLTLNSSIELYYNSDGNATPAYNEYYYSDTTLTLNKYYFFCIVKKGSDITLLISSEDGSTTDNIVLSTDINPFQYSGNWYLGTQIDSARIWTPFQGIIDDVRIFNRALSIADIQELYVENSIYPLTIVKAGSGNGTVTSNPSGINCGNSCSANFANGVNVTLIATPASGSIFGGFSGDADCVDRQVTMNAAKTCTAIFNLPLPVVTTNVATDVTQTSASLNGSVISSGAVAAISFDFGTTTAYGTSVIANPSQVYSSSAIAVIANKVDLACGTTYHYRTKAVASSGMRWGLDQSFTTDECVIHSWLYPANLNVIKNKSFTLDVIANSDNVKIGMYEFLITIDVNKLDLDTSYCNQGVCPGVNALTNNIVHVNNATGTITVTGQGGVTDFGNDLQLLVLHLRSKIIPGITQVKLVTNKLETINGEVIGLGSKDANINVSHGLCGDVDGNNSVNIVDALGVSRRLVGLPPPPTVDEILADTNRNGRVDINDALFIARYTIGLVLPPESCVVGQLL